MINQPLHALVNKQNGNLAFRLSRLEENYFSGQLQRYNYFSLIWITGGSGKIKTGVSEYEFKENSLFAFSPFQPFLFSTANPIKGIVINFHSEFISFHQKDKEMDFRKVLYSNVYQPPLIRIDVNSASVFSMLCEKIKAEIQLSSLAQHEILAAYLRIFLITASRLKIEQQPQVDNIRKESKKHYILQKLKDAIEENFRAKHSPVEYAAILFVTTKTLAKASKSYYNKTISGIINERIIAEAKSELYLTDKPVKEIAYELGYEDEYYFSRFFKVNTKISPKNYRNTVRYIRA
ncbi:MAG: helix-turn-helix domain-containing protein [Ginsengibacter sp.]